jgi:hypothetical protein
VAAWVGYTIWDDSRRVNAARLRMEESELEVRYGIAEFRLMLDERDRIQEE